jgi:hypothetical protein
MADPRAQASNLLYGTVAGLAGAYLFGSRGSTRSRGTYDPADYPISNTQRVVADVLSTGNTEGIDNQANQETVNAVVHGSRALQQYWDSWRGSAPARPTTATPAVDQSYIEYLAGSLYALSQDPEMWAHLSTVGSVVMTGSLHALAPSALRLSYRALKVLTSSSFRLATSAAARALSLRLLSYTVNLGAAKALEKGKDLAKGGVGVALEIPKELLELGKKVYNEAKSAGNARFDFMSGDQEVPDSVVDDKFYEVADEALKTAERRESSIVSYQKGLRPKPPPDTSKQIAEAVIDLMPQDLKPALDSAFSQVEFPRFSELNESPGESEEEEQLMIEPRKGTLMIIYLVFKVFIIFLKKKINIK